MQTEARSPQVYAPAPARPSTPTYGPLDAAMQRYAAGDESAFREVFRGLAPRLRGFLRSLCRSELLADDLLQDTFLRMHRARSSFTAGQRVQPWAFAIARNCFINHARAAKSRHAQASCDISEHPVATGKDDDVEERAAARELAHLIDRTLAHLPALHRETLSLMCFEGLSVAATAQRLGTSQGAIKLRSFRAHAGLRAGLRMQGLPPDLRALQHGSLA